VISTNAPTVAPREALEGVPPLRRVALVSNLCPHYRRSLYEVLATRFELECYFFADREPYWNPLLPALEHGDFGRVAMRRVKVLGEPLLPGIARRLTRARYDAVIMNLAGRLMVPYVYATARARHLPVALWTGAWVHPRTPFHRLTEGGAHSLYRRADSIIVYGDHVRRALVSISGVDNAKIFTAAQAVDGRRFSVSSDPARSREILFVGRFEEEKGLRELIAAFGIVGDPSLRLSVVGNGSLEPELRSAASQDPRIRMVGHVPQDELPAHLARARFLVIPSITTPTFSEPWGLVANEAMHAGLPVIATDAVGAAAHGLVENMRTGLVVPERDPTALAHAISLLSEADELVSSLGAAARTRVSAYTFEAMADAVEAAVRYARASRT